MTTETREDLLSFSKLCEKARRFDEMVETMKKLVKIDANLSNEERETLSTAYKGAMSLRHTSWLALCSITQRMNAAGFTDEQMLLTDEYCDKIEAELLAIYHEVLECVNEVLLPKANDVEATVFYLNMKGNYYRYMVQVAPMDDRAVVIELSKQAYQDGLDKATEEMKASNPTRLNLLLNYSVFYFEVLKLADSARKMAKKALDEAAAEVDTKEVPKETENVLQQIRDNLILWQQEPTTGDGGVQSAL